MSPEDAENFERTLELGKELATDLDQNDVLGRWMAHHVGELVARVESAAGEPGTDDLRNTTRDAILALWRHRREAPMRSRPTYTLDKVLEATIRLGDDEPGHFYKLFQPGLEPNQDQLQSLRVLRAAIDVESSVRELVERAVLQAFKEASTNETKWLQLSDHLVDDDQRQSARTLVRLQNQARRRRLTTEGAQKFSDVTPEDQLWAATHRKIEGLMKLLETDDGARATDSVIDSH